MTGIDSYLSDFRRADGNAPARVRTVREAALGRFAELGFPTLRMEEWKYTNVAPIAKIPFQLANGSGSAVTRTALDAVGCPGACELVFVNGRYVSALSTLEPVTAGTKVTSLGDAFATERELVDAHLARYADYQSQSFTALNTAFITDGAFVYVPRSTVLKVPIHLLFVSTTSGASTVSHPRVLIVAEESAQATVVESYVGLGSGAYFTNAVTEIALGPNAHLTHYKLQRENDAAFHVASVVARQDAASHFVSHSVSLGGALVRSDTTTTLAAEGCECALNGLYMVAGTQHVDHHTVIDHVQPHCSSRELYKGVLDGRATGVFNGKVFVRPQAQHSDAGQVNKNLLLSDNAVMNTKPQLEIFADDVKCSHGATIGRLDEDAIFYLRSRGIGAATARDLLIYAFANELLDGMAVEPVRQQLERILSSRFQRGGGTEEAR